MNKEDKDKLHATMSTTAAAGANRAAAAAKCATGWKKWALYIAAGLGYALAGLSAFVQFGCTQAQVREAGHVIHEIYHYDTGTPCVFDEGGK